MDTPSKISNLELTMDTDKDIFRFDISMYHMLLV